MAGRTGVRDIGSDMIRIGCLIICIGMTGGTYCRCSAESVRMTSAAENGRMGTRQREAGIIMVEGSIYAACRVT